MNRLLNPKVSFCYRKWLTEDKMLALLKKLKSKKFGAKVYAVDVEEVQLDKEILLDSKFWYVTKTKLKPGTYFHIRVEYIV